MFVMASLYLYIVGLFFSFKIVGTITAGEGVERRLPSYTVGRNVNWYNHYRGQYGDSLKKLKIEPPYDPAIPLPGIYPEQTIIWKDRFTPVFTAALFIAANTVKQPKCPRRCSS